MANVLIITYDNAKEDHDDDDDLKGKRRHLSQGSTSVNYIQQPESQ